MYDHTFCMCVCVCLGVSCCLLASYIDICLVPVIMATGITTHIVEGTGSDRGSGTGMAFPSVWDWL